MPRASGDVGHRVDGRPVAPQLEVHVAPRDVAGGAGVPDRLALRDPLARADREPRQVVVDAHPRAAVDDTVVDQHLVAVGAVARRGPHPDHRAGRGRHLRLAAARPQVDALVEEVATGDRVPAHPVRRRHVQRAADRLDEGTGAAPAAATAAGATPAAARAPAGAAAPTATAGALLLLCLLGGDAGLSLALGLLCGRDAGDLVLDLLVDALVLGLELGLLLGVLLAALLQLGRPVLLLGLALPDLDDEVLGALARLLRRGDRVLRLGLELDDPLLDGVEPGLPVAVDRLQVLQVGEGLVLRAQRRAHRRVVLGELLGRAGAEDQRQRAHAVA